MAEKPIYEVYSRHSVSTTLPVFGGAKHGNPMTLIGLL
jgi:hypothetical protein